MRFQPIYKEAGVRLPDAFPATDDNAKRFGSDAIVVAPPSAQNTPWMRKFAPFSTAFVSGWMQVRGAKRRRNVDRGFIMSDHADWDGLLRTADETGATAVTVMHGFPNSLSRYLSERGLNAVDAPHRPGGEGEAAPLAVDEVGA
jgi:putative mRNA 3-end processing factor